MLTRPTRQAVLHLIVAFVAFVGLVSHTVRAAGVFEDAAAEAGFLCAPQRNAVVARMTTTSAPVVSASVVVMGARFDVSPWLLFAIEQPFVTASSDADGVVTGFGDLRLRSRITLARRPGKRLSLLPAVGTGSGTTDVFPYASQALELGAALAWSDTMGVVEYWATGGGVLVRRAPTGLSPALRHVGFTRISAGTAYAIGRGGIRVGGEYLGFQGGFARAVFFAQFTWDVRDRFRFGMSGSVESGHHDVRVMDSSVAVNLDVSF